MSFFSWGSRRHCPVEVDAYDVDFFADLRCTCTVIDACLARVSSQTPPIDFCAFCASAIAHSIRSVLFFAL